MPAPFKGWPGEIVFDPGTLQWLVRPAANPNQLNPCRSHAHALAASAEALVLLNPSANASQKNQAIAAAARAGQPTY